MSRFAGLWTGLKTVTDTVEAAGTIDVDSSRPQIILPEVERPTEGLNSFKGDYFPLPQERRLMVFKLVMAAAKTWRRLKGENQLPKVVQGVTFTNGVEVINTPAQNAA